MNLFLKIRRLGLEITLFIFLLFFGYAAFWTYRYEQGIQSEQARLEASLKQFEAAKKAFEEAKKAIPKENPFPSFIKVLDSSKIQDEYVSLAESIESKTRDFQKTLREFAAQKRTFTQGDAKSEELKRKTKEWNDFLESLNTSVAKEKLVEESQALQKELASGTNAAYLNFKDLKERTNQINQLSLNYLAEAELFRKNASGSTGLDAIQIQLASLGNKSNRLLDLTKKLRADAAAIGSYRKSKLSIEFNRQANIFAKGIVAEASELPLPGSPVLVEHLRIQDLFYALVLGSFGLFVLLLVSCYRMFVIVPLRDVLAQRDATIQRQDMLSHFGQLAAELAHEIRNPLTAINARLYTLQKSMSRGTPEFTDASIIGNEINRLDRIVKDFLKVARPAEPRFISLIAEPFLKEVQELLAPEYEKQSIQLKCEVEKDAAFRGDPQQLKQVLINLVQNAADSIEHDGEIILRARREKMDLQGKPTKVVLLEVEDHGPGVPPEVRERLFDPFFSTKKSGTGLGLAISARIVEKHSGLLNFESHSGRTIFRVALPIRQD